jgi:hypothetical protein
MINVIPLASDVLIFCFVFVFLFQKIEICTSQITHQWSRLQCRNVLYQLDMTIQMEGSMSAGLIQAMQSLANQLA